MVSGGEIKSNHSWKSGRIITLIILTIISHEEKVTDAKHNELRSSETFAVYIVVTKKKHF